MNTVTSAPSIRSGKSGMANPPKPKPTFGSGQLRLFGINLSFLKNWKFFAVYFIPMSILWVTLLQNGNDDMKCLFIMLLIGLYWMMDCIPLPVVGFIPLIVFCLLKLEKAKATMENYMKDVTMMTFSCIIIVLSAQSSGLSKRIALKILSLTGANLRAVLYYIMMISALFSMWFVNTAIMMFMIKVVEEIIHELNHEVGIGTLGDKKMDKWNDLALEAEKALALPNVTPSKEIQESEGEGPTDQPEKQTASVTQQQSIEKPEEEKVEEDDDGIPDSTPSNLAPADNNQQTTTQSVPSNASMIVNRSDENPENDEKFLLKLQIDEFLDMYKVSLFHCAAVAANIGGLLWPHTSTSSCAIYHFLAKPIVSPLPKYMNLALWMNFTFPIIIIVFIAALVNMEFVYFRGCGPCKSRILEETKTRPETRQKIQQAYKDKYLSLGKFNSHEIGVIVVLVLSVVLFLMRSPGFMWGWQLWFTKREGLIIKDSTTASIIAVLTFVIPKCGTDMFQGPKSPKDKASFNALLGWKVVQQNFPWGLLIFIGGGVALAVGIVEPKKSNSTFLEESKFDLMMQRLFLVELGSPAPARGFVLLMSLLTSVALSHFITNTAAAIIAVKVFGSVSMKLGWGWCYLTIPCVAVCSFSFLLPAGTPTMALAHMKTHQLSGQTCIRRGWALTILAVSIVYFFGLFYTEQLINCGSQNP